MIMRGIVVVDDDGKDDDDDVPFAEAVLSSSPIVETTDAPLIAEAAEAKVPLAEGVFLEDDEAVKVSVEELDIRADPEGARRRGLCLRDALCTGAPLRLRPQALEDVEALLLRDSERSMTLLHWAARYGRAEALRELLNFIFENEKSFMQRLGDAPAKTYCMLRDEDGRRAIDHARMARHKHCVDFLMPFEDFKRESDDDDDDDSKDSSKDDRTAQTRRAGAKQDSVGYRL